MTKGRRSFGKAIASAMLLLPLVVSPAAATPSTISAAPAAEPSHAWFALSLLMPRSPVLNAAFQKPPPPPPPKLSGGGGGARGGLAKPVTPSPDTVPAPADYAVQRTPPIPVMLVWLGVVATGIYLATRHNHHHDVPNSPA